METPFFAREGISLALENISICTLFHSAMSSKMGRALSKDQKL
jgi:hypothetical protein